MKSDDVLFDDYNKNLEEWSAAGGISIKCVNNINHKGLHGALWEGMCIENTSDILDKYLPMCAVEIMNDKEALNESEEDYDLEM